MKKKKSIAVLLILTLLSFQIRSETQKKASVITEGDYGLSLEQHFIFETTQKTDVKKMTRDSEGNLYCILWYINNINYSDKIRFTTQGNNNVAIAKFTPQGDVAWVKNIHYTSDNPPIQDVDDYLLEYTEKGNLVLWMSLGSNCRTVFYYGEEELYSYSADRVYPDDTDWADFLITIDAQTGALKDKMEFSFRRGIYCDPYQNNIIVKEDGTIYMSGQIYERFTGFNDQKPSTMRSTNEADRFLVKLSPDYEILWEFVINGNKDDDTYDDRVSDYLFQEGDTLYYYVPFKSEEIDISPDKSQPEIVSMPSGKKVAMVLCKYQVSGDTPILLDYKLVDSEEEKLIYMSANSSGKIIGSKKNTLNYSTKRWDNRYWCAELTSDLNINILTDFPYQLPSHGIGVGLGPGGNCFYFDEADNYIYMGEYPPSPSGFSNNPGIYPIKFSETLGELERDTNNDKDNLGYIAKYDTTNRFRWALELRDVDVHSKSFMPELGKVYLGGSIMANTGTVDLDPSSEGSAPCKTLYTGLLAQYVETYRIKAEESNFGRILVPDTLVWHGRDCEIQVVAQEGYQVDSVKTSRGDHFSANAQGKYPLCGVTDAVTVSAFYSSLSGEKTYPSETFETYPNPVSDYLYLKNTKEARYTIIDLSGRTMQCGRATENHIDVRALPEGIYTLILQDGKNTYIKKIEKEKQ